MSKTIIVILLYAASIISIFMSLYTDKILEEIVFSSLSILLSLLVFKLLKENYKLVNK